MGGESGWRVLGGKGAAQTEPPPGCCPSRLCGGWGGKPGNTFWQPFQEGADLRSVARNRAEAGRGGGRGGNRTYSESELGVDRQGTQGERGTEAAEFCVRATGGRGIRREGWRPHM